MTLHSAEIVSDFYQTLEARWGDVIAKQCRFDPQENDDFFPLDGLNEDEVSHTARLIQRYPHHALLIATGRCATRCRFCFRRRLWSDETAMRDISDRELHDALAYLKSHPQVHEILITGGDPLMLGAERLDFILNALSKLDSITRIRVGTRLPIVDPLSITDEMIEVLSKHKVSLMLHINHPAELTDPFISVAKKFQQYQISLFTQTVLLKGVNDNSETLIRLCQTLSMHQIKPHYLFHVDPVQGVSHFATGLRRAHAIAREMRLILSSLEMPQLCIDLPHGKGKVQISPDYPLPKTLEFISPIDGAFVRYPFE